MKITPSVVLDAPTYYVSHFNGTYDTEKCVVVRDLGIECDEEAMPAVLAKLPKSTHILDLTNNELNEIPDLSAHNEIMTLLLGRNRISKIDGRRLPRRLRRLVLASNAIEQLAALEGLRDAPKTLENLSLRGNGVCHLEDYRVFVVSRAPQLKTLDFTKVGDQERSAGRKFRKSPGKGTAPLQKEFKDKNEELMDVIVGKMSDEVRNRLKDELAAASTLDEIERIEKLLSGGV
ncbi:LAQU0S08e03642g1_1 [Lachancea quebecensis]|uniref:U2 small nuclear ribonucleoprotein A' n=1 Tax=Lachancea quebecensis TaxID=1654605 RepID=A0A0N7MLT3_9SACH|nr:LAQU0S08e03642g1_1 [Lachancea quebecensis]